MKINLNNYELYAIEYLEGNLDAISTKEMEAFLLEHPHIAQEFKGLHDFILEIPEKINIEDSFKIKLKKNTVTTVGNINEDTYIHFFIAHKENDLSVKDKKDLQVFLETNPSLIPEKEQIQSLKLQADLSIVYADKENLKRQEKPIVLLKYAFSLVAAIILLAFWLWNPQDIAPERNYLNKLQSISTANLEISSKAIILSEATNIRRNFDWTKEYAEIRDTISINKLISKNKSLAIEDNNWKNEILLMQSYAFERTQLTTEVNWNKMNTERKRPFRLVASLLWKTTKGQIKNISEDVLPENKSLRELVSLENLSGGFISFEKQTKEVE